MKTVRDILRDKGHDVWSVAVGATVYAALQLMAEKNVGAVLVLEQGKLAGILSERDYSRKVALKGRTSLNTPVREIMTQQIFYVRPDQTIDECMALMTEKHIRHLPVFDGDTIAGVVSIGDVVKAIVSEQKITIQQYENYILGRGYGQ